MWHDERDLAVAPDLPRLDSEDNLESGNFVLTVAEMMKDFYHRHRVDKPLMT